MSNGAIDSSSTLFGYRIPLKIYVGARKAAHYSPLSTISLSRSTIQPPRLLFCMLPISNRYKKRKMSCRDEEANLIRALKGHFSALEEKSDVPGVNEARGYACEFVAGQFLTSLKDSDVMNFLLVELPPLSTSISRDEETQCGRGASRSNERTPLLPNPNGDYFTHDSPAATRFTSLASQCENLSALEIASVSGAKKFLGQRPVQKIINGLFRGDIVFWETLSVQSVKKPRKYNRRQADLCKFVSTQSHRHSTCRHSIPK